MVLAVRTEIGTYAFYSQGRYMSSIHEIVIPSTVKSIGTGALTEMGYVDQIVIPDTVETIEKGAIKSTYRIICSSGSEAYRYAKENNNPITLSDLSVTLETTRLDLKTGETATLRVTVTPDQYKPVFSSSNTGVATVDEAGLVTAVGQGYASITVTTGTDRQSCAVYVTDPPKPYAIKYMLRGGTNHPANPDTLAEGEKLTLLNPTREDYVFDGWYLREIVETNYAWGWVGYRYEDPVKTLTGVPDQSVTVYASWTKLDVQSPQKMKLTNKTGRKLSISIEKVKNAKGYEVEYSYSSSFPKKKTTHEEIKKNKLSVSGLKKKGTEYEAIHFFHCDYLAAFCFPPDACYRRCAERRAIQSDHVRIECGFGGENNAAEGQRDAGRSRPEGDMGVRRSQYCFGGQQGKRKREKERICFHCRAICRGF